MSRSRRRARHRRPHRVTLVAAPLALGGAVAAVALGASPLADSLGGGGGPNSEAQPGNPTDGESPDVVMIQPVGGSTPGSAADGSAERGAARTAPATRTAARRRCRQLVRRRRQRMPRRPRWTTASSRSGPRRPVQAVEPAVVVRAARRRRPPPPRARPAADSCPSRCPRRPPRPCRRCRRRSCRPAADVAGADQPAGGRCRPSRCCPETPNAPPRQCRAGRPCDVWFLVVPGTEVVLDHEGLLSYGAIGDTLRSRVRVDGWCFPALRSARPCTQRLRDGGGRPGGGGPGAGNRAPGNHWVGCCRPLYRTNRPAA